MIVLKATQDKVLAALQSVAGIVERRHTLPILRDVLIGKFGAGNGLAIEKVEVQIHRPHDTRVRVAPARRELGLKTRPVGGFFSVMKVNLRNAP